MERKHFIFKNIFECVATALLKNLTSFLPGRGLLRLKPFQDSYNEHKNKYHTQNIMGT